MDEWERVSGGEEGEGRKRTIAFAELRSLKH